MSRSREVRLATVPVGLPQPADFEVVEVPVPTPGDGEALVRNRYFHVFAALRTLFGGGVEGAPFPPIHPGDTLFGAAVGEVVSAPAGSGLRPGELVSHWLGWREYAAVPAAQCQPLGDVLPDPVAHLTQGRTAYSALLQSGLKAGETVFVSGGAGAVGSLAGQVARLLGADRVIGSTGSPAKARRLVSELGYDAAVLRGGEPFHEQLAKAAPDGIDVMVDNVGGEQLRAALTVARPGARFVLVGALDGQLDPNGSGTSAPVELDIYQVILKHVTLRGLDNSVATDWVDRFGAWLRQGEITVPQVRVVGIEHAARALSETIGGRHLGTVIVEL
ncbi:MDR family NADP-dependent oxidoreductase [Frankia sp. AgKG'84/4]|uniref:MDR family NADP-dependent oxidoreductase n=1 Tax=Frankia sp. AgKG'84/4 TaxID=573490 RepID=UPI00200E6920|nr:NADP-dependent oxidoreductase [Frankia sp. AgKG'84/4]MCL9792946.1 NADP-dependent oxidoreductase [Frankia sp. AgKG'84/4]